MSGCGSHHRSSALTTNAPTCAARMNSTHDLSACTCTKTPPPECFCTCTTDTRRSAWVRGSRGGCVLRTSFVSSKSAGGKSRLRKNGGKRQRGQRGPRVGGCRAANSRETRRCRLPLPVTCPLVAHVGGFREPLHHTDARPRGSKAQRTQCPFSSAKDPLSKSWERVTSPTSSSLSKDPLKNSAFFSVEGRRYAACHTGTRVEGEACQRTGR
jgi:hypothetical protein